MYPIDPSGNQAHRRLALLLPALFCLSASLACGAVDDDRMFECPEPLLDSGVLKTELADQPLSGALRQQWTEDGRLGEHVPAGRPSGRRLVLSRAGGLFGLWAGI
ncbi:MAG: hypothetical protein IT318_02800 [Anaerolineales bacterium]|nr:hypothetical protein [Anaerolineales bacterium]